jgi:hypothetical protein
MDALNNQDTLSEEVSRLARERGGKFRPNTTGELDVKNGMKLSKRNTAEHYVDKFDEASKLRPRAPIQSRRAVEGVQQDETGQKKKRGSRKSRKPKSGSIADLYEALQHFSKNNFGRSLNIQVLTVCNYSH